MLDQFTVDTLTDTLFRLEDHAELLGWDSPPQLFGLFRRQHTADAVTIEADPSLVEPDLWLLPDPANPARGIAPGINLLLLSCFLTDEPTRLADWLGPHTGTCVGFAFMCQAWQSTGYVGYQYGDLNTVPAMAEQQVRTVTGIDTDHRYYQVIRARGQQACAVRRHDSLPCRTRDSHIGAGLLRLLHLAGRNPTESDQR